MDTDNQVVNRGWLFRNIANFITILGVFLCSPLWWIVFFQRDQIRMLVIFIGAVLVTDWLDGKVARALNIVSNFGAAIDRLRDKFLLAPMFLFLLLDVRVDLPLKVIVVPLALVEALLLGTCFVGIFSGFFGIFKGLSISANKWGKIKMFVVPSTIILCLLNILAEERWGQNYHTLTTIILVLMLLGGFLLTVMSLWGYISKYLPWIRAK